MPKITTRKPLKKFWETASDGVYMGGRTKPISVAVSPGFVEVKLKGTREVYRVPWGAILSLGIKMQVASGKA